MNKFVFCIFLFFITTTVSKAQLSIGAGYGMYYISNTDFKYKNTSGFSLIAAYNDQQFKFGLAYAFLADSEIDESWALGEFNRQIVVSNSSKFIFERNLRLFGKMSLLKDSPKFNFLLGGQMDIYYYAGSGEIEMTTNSGSNSTTIGILEEQPGSLNIGLTATFEYYPHENIILFLEGALPVMKSDAAISRIELGTSFLFRKKSKE